MRHFVNSLQKYNVFIYQPKKKGNIFREKFPAGDPVGNSLDWN